MIYTKIPTSTSLRCYAGALLCQARRQRVSSNVPINMRRRVMRARASKSPGAGAAMTSDDGATVREAGDPKIVVCIWAHLGAHHRACSAAHGALQSRDIIVGQLDRNLPDGPAKSLVVKGPVIAASDFCRVLLWYRASPVPDRSIADP